MSQEIAEKSNLRVLEQNYTQILKRLAKIPCALKEATRK